MSEEQRAPIVQERVFDATPAEVFAAWGEAEAMRVWMCPGDIESADVEVDFRTGGMFRIAMHAESGDFVQHGEYLAVEPPKRLVYTWVSEWMPEGQQHTRVEVTFEAVGDQQTRLRLVHDSLPAGDGYDGHVEGWRSILGKLEAHLASR